MTRRSKKSAPESSDLNRPTWSGISATVMAEVATLGPDAILFLAAEYIRLFATLAIHDKHVSDAYKNGDVSLARREVEAMMEVLSVSAYRTVPREVRKRWFDKGSEFSVFDFIGDAVKYARAGHRHWITALESDDLPTPAVDITRAMIEGRSAAILEIFSRQNGGRTEVANAIANHLTKAGFFTKRKQQAVKGSTVQDWLRYINGHKSQKEHMSPTGRHAAARYHLFWTEKEPLTKLTYRDALELLEHDTRTFASRLVGADPRKP